MDIILKCILEKLDLYSTKGILISASGGEKVLKPKLLMLSLNLVARPIAVSTVQFNGYFGCIHEGVYKYGRMLYPPLKHYIKRCKNDMEL